MKCTSQLPYRKTFDISGYKSVRTFHLLIKSSGNLLKINAA